MEGNAIEMLKQFILFPDAHPIEFQVKDGINLLCIGTKSFDCEMLIWDSKDVGFGRTFYLIDVVYSIIFVHEAQQDYEEIMHTLNRPPIKSFHRSSLHKRLNLSSPSTHHDLNLTIVGNYTISTSAPVGLELAPKPIETTNARIQAPVLSPKPKPRSWLTFTTSHGKPVSNLMCHKALKIFKIFVNSGVSRQNSIDENYLIKSGDVFIYII